MPDIVWVGVTENLEIKNGTESQNKGAYHFILVCFATPFQDAIIACIGLSHSSLIKCKANCIETMSCTGNFFFF